MLHKAERITYGFYNVILIHAPTEDKVNMVKETFYDPLDSLFTTIPKQVAILLLGDLYANVGREKVLDLISEYTI